MGLFYHHDIVCQILTEFYLLSFISFTGMKSIGGDLETWEWLFERYQNETNAQEKLKLLRGLTAVEVPWLLRSET